MRVPMTEYLEIDLDSERWLCRRCSRDLAPASGDYKHGTLVHDRDPREIHRPLIDPDRYERSLVEDDVSRLQNGIIEQTNVDVVGLLLRLVLELCHPPQLAEGRHRIQDPTEFGVLGHARLDEQDRALRIDPACKEISCHLQRTLGQNLGIVVLSNGVVVHNAEEATVLVLQSHPVPNGPKVVAQVQFTGRLDATKDSFHGSLFVLLAAEILAYHAWACYKGLKMILECASHACALTAGSHVSG